PILHPFVRELRGSDRFRVFAAAFPAAARVSEPALPLLLAALHEELDRALVLLAPEDADARDLAEAVAWFVGDERVALLPSRGGAAPRRGRARAGGRARGGPGAPWGVRRGAGAGSRCRRRTCGRSRSASPPARRSASSSCRSRSRLRATSASNAPTSAVSSPC